MNKYLLKLLMASLLISLSACEFEMSDNGDLDGFWQLCTVDTLATGHSSDMRQIGIYWSVQMHILSIENKPRFIRFLFRFEQSDNQLRIYSPRLDNRISDSEREDALVTNAEDLRVVGLDSIENSFQIVQLNGSRMILQNDHCRMYLRRY